MNKRQTKPLVTRNQAIYQEFLAKKASKEKNKKAFIVKEVILILLVFGLIYIGINFPAFSSMVKYNWNVTILNKESIPPSQDPRTEPIQLSTTSMLTITKIGVEVPIIWDIPFKDIHDNLDNGVVHYNETAHPGQQGNMFIVGHSSDYSWSKGKYKNIFALLPQLPIGENIKIEYLGKDYTYQVVQKKVIAPTDISVLQPTEDATLTLMTCWPIGTSQKRYITIAKLISPTPDGRQIVYPSILSLPKAR